MEELQKKFNLKEFKIVSYSVKSKQNHPIVCLVCKKGKRYFMIKTPLNDNDNYVKKAFKKECEILNFRYPLLNPQLINGLYLKTNYIFSPSLSFHMNKLFSSKKIVDRTIKWLAEFHNEKHKDGIGQIHGDFSPHDIIVNKRDIIVLDWEDCEDKNYQLIDIYYFIYRCMYSYVLPSNKEKNLTNFINALLGSNLHPYLKKYMAYRKMKFSLGYRKKALLAFLDQRLKRENELYSIPKKDRHNYRLLKKILLKK
jgi:hypothetical protein